MCTSESSSLTDEQKLFYEKNGYILIKNNLNPEFLDELRQRFEDLCEGTAQNHGVSIVKDPVLKKRGISGQYAVNKFQDIFDDEVLGKYGTCKEIVDVVEQLIGPNITGIYSMLINKPPESNPDISRHPLHQDLHYFPFRPANKIVTAWTAMERLDEKNGCLHVIPGSHNGPLYNHEYPEGNKHKLYHEVTGMNHLPKLHVIMEKGDTIFFHSLLLHGSGPNFTKGFRKAISCHYADSNCTFMDINYGRMAKEIEDMEETKTGVPLNIQNYFKARSRLIRGNPGALQQFYSNL
ncbi:phytanoyl-CoA dioxygenase, peroxisomal isoform X3 [Leptinotarsa decemlineata]|uniref:phytanoyl-CoA dioxygenase, peroxisomal isoform X3 n=1 Tax=Leptinotarsa decemlineata TaxID=7539 RepID=UPI003D307E9F